MKTQDKQFRNLLKSYQPETAPADFTKKVMDQIYQERVLQQYKPLFGKRFLPIFGGLFAAFIILALLYIVPGDTTSNPGFISSLFSNISNIELSKLGELGEPINRIFNQIPSLFFVVCFSSLILLLFDWTLQRFKKFPVR